MEYDVINELSTLTTMPEKSIRDVVDKISDIMCHDVLSSKKNLYNISTLDIGIGTVHIMVNDKDIKYKFIPSKDFENKLIKTIVDGKSPVITRLEELVTKKLYNHYKELY